VSVLPTADEMKVGAYAQNYQQTAVSLAQNPTKHSVDAG